MQQPRWRAARGRDLLSRGWPSGVCGPAAKVIPWEGGGNTVMVLSRSRIRGEQARSTARALLVPLVLLVGFLAFPSPALGAGALDPTFDGDGKVVTDFGGVDRASDIAIQADGKIVAVGKAGSDPNGN